MTPHGEEAQIRSLIEDWAAALRAKDVSRVMSHQTADATQFTLAPPLISTDGTDELQSWFDNWRGPIGFETRDQAIVARDGIAFSHGLIRMTATSVGGEEADLWFRLTLGFRKIEGTWKIVHTHESVPFYMDGSYRAAIDLKP